MHVDSDLNGITDQNNGIDAGGLTTTAAVTKAYWTGKITISYMHYLLTSTFLFIYWCTTLWSCWQTVLLNQPKHAPAQELAHQNLILLYSVCVWEELFFELNRSIGDGLLVRAKDGLQQWYQHFHERLLKSKKTGRPWWYWIHISHTVNYLLQLFPPAFCLLVLSVSVDWCSPVNAIRIYYSRF